MELSKGRRRGKRRQRDELRGQGSSKLERARRRELSRQKEEQRLRLSSEPQESW
jgi:hypothetical protein